jgi:very-short-patch-repair endonuclease
MNHEIAVPDEVRKIARRSNIRFDLYWPEQRVALEYDGRKHHSNETDVTGDTGRRDAAVAMGIMYFSVRYGQIADVNAMDDVFRSVAKALGYRLRIRTDNFAEKRGELRSILLPGSAN